MAVNCWVEPTARLSGEAGVTAMEDNVGVGVGVVAGFDLHATTPIVIVASKATIKK
jgi:hypothetical protein